MEDGKGQGREQGGEEAPTPPRAGRTAGGGYRNVTFCGAPSTVRHRKSHFCGAPGHMRHRNVTFLWRTKHSAPQKVTFLWRMWPGAPQKVVWGGTGEFWGKKFCGAPGMVRHRKVTFCGAPSLVRHRIFSSDHTPPSPRGSPF